MRLIRLFPLALLALALALPVLAPAQESPPPEQPPQDQPPPPQEPGPPAPPPQAQQPSPPPPPAAPVAGRPGSAKLKVRIPAVKRKGKRKGSPARTSTVELGIADEKPQMFSDPRFHALGLRIARRSVAWDVARYDWALAEVDQWMQDALRTGVRPLITFGRSRIKSRLHYIPTRADYLSAFKQFRARYPWVTDFVATNESNYSDPGFKRPELAARYYNDMRKACPRCKIAAATILEVPGREKATAKWVRRFLKVAKKPKYWAVHNYVSANRLSLKGTKRILKLTKTGEIWITEVGGLVRRRSSFAGKVKMREGLKHAEKVTKFILDRMPKLSPRIKRLYLYHWNSATPTDTWDSALVGSDGQARKTLDLIAKRLKRR